MHFFTHQLLLLCKRLLLLLGLFSLGRFYFYIHNIRYFASAWPDEVIKSFFYGIQFDLSAIIYINILVILMHLIPGKLTENRMYGKTLKFLFFLINGILLAFSLVDAEYFRFTGKRTTSDIFHYTGTGNDFLNLIPRFIYDYWYILLVWILLMYLAWKLYPGNGYKRTERVSFSTGRIIIHSIAALLATAFLISLGRGYRLKPIRVITASHYVSPQNMPLILNTPFTIMKSFNKQRLKVPDYFPMEKAESLFLPVHETGGTGERKEYNVVIIIMESFSSEFSGYLNGSKGYMPFLDTLMQQSLLFPNAYANARKSLEALPAIMASIPALSETPFISSPYSSNNINSLPDELRGLGYHTSFFHGGINGTMGFDDFARLAGIDNYYGKTEFGNDKYYDGYWGIPDEEFFQYFAMKLNSFPQPFFSCFFSLSSHHPYIIPEKHRGRFSHGDQPVHKTISYADFSLEKFFKTISSMPWFRNTLFVITADHTAKSYNPYYQNVVDDYRVPVLYYHPDDNELKGKNYRLTQHIDIMPSVLDYLNVGTRFISFGSSVFSAGEPGYVVNYLNGLYKLMENDRVLFFDGERSVAMYNFINDRKFMNNYLENTGYANLYYYQSKLKSIIQQYNCRVVNNRMKQTGSLTKNHRDAFQVKQSD